VDLVNPITMTCSDYWGEKKRWNWKLFFVSLGYFIYEFRRSSVVHDKSELLFRKKSDSL